MRKKKYFLDDKQVADYILDAVIMYGMTSSNKLWETNLSVTFYKMLMNKGFLAETVERINVRTNLYSSGNITITINEIGRTYYNNRFVLENEQLPEHVKGRLNDIVK